MSDITLLLAKCQQVPSARAELLDLIYGELKLIAAARLQGESPARTLQATDLVHESFLRLFRNTETSWENRRHFFASATEVMRRIVIDQARRRNSQKRGNGADKVPLYEVEIATTTHDPADLSLALETLAEREPEEAEFVRLRYFAGMTIQEAAETMGISTRTANRMWQHARVLLLRELRE